MCALAAQVFVGLDNSRNAAVAAAVTQELRNDLHRERQGQTRLLVSKINNIRLEDNRPDEEPRAIASQ